MKTNAVFENLLSESVLQSLAGKASFERGQKYFKNGKIGELVMSGDTLRAVVKGSDLYHVRLDAAHGKLGFSCNCYHAGDGNFCKHCVAVGLAWLARASGKDAESPSLQAIRAYLQALDPSQLVDLVVDAARLDEDLCRALLLKSQRRDRTAAGAGKLRQLLDAATEVDGFVAWNEVGEFLEPLHQVLDTAADMLEPATSAALIDLLEHGIGRAEDMLEDLDDSNGDVGDVIARMGQLHLQACRLAAPDPAALADRLFGLEMNSTVGVWSFGPVAYRDVLGGAGISRYRELILAESRAAGRDARAWLEHMLESVAEASGDIDQLVAVKSRDLSTPYRYLQIATILQEACRTDDAIDWAERGLAAFARSPDSSLYEFLAEAYQTSGKHEDALRMAWKLFAARPCLQHFGKLSRSAEQLGCWPDYRKRALAEVEAAIGRARRNAVVSLRVEIALSEQDLDAALAFANRGRCDSGLLIKLAAALEPSRLDDAGVLYRRLVAEMVALTNNQAYEDATALLRRYAVALQAQQRHAELSAYLDGLRTEFKRKRNFIGLLDRCGFAIEQ